MTLQEELDRFQARRREWDQYFKDAPRRELEHQIQMAETRLSIWAKAEKQRREEKPQAFDYIRQAKQRRKQAENDLVWLREQLNKLV